MIAYAESKGVTWEDEDTQIEFLVAEISGQGLASEYASKRTEGYIGDEHIIATSEDWKNATNIEDATLFFMRFFESPGEKKTYETRLGYAKDYYSKFKGKKKPTDGSEKTSDKAGIRGYYKSSSGKTYTEYYQNIQGSAWYSTDGCFHCSLATIISGFGSTKTPNQLTGFSYGSGCWGNKIDFTNAGCKYEQISSSNVKNALKKGDPIMIYVSPSGTLTTDNGSHTLAYGHWLSMLDYKRSNGKDKVYIHDPWKGDACWGWGDLDTVNKSIGEFWHVWK